MGVAACMDMTDRIHAMLISALRAAGNGIQPRRALEQAILAGDLTLPLNELDFDSLAWMEFCISIEVQSRLELTPADIAPMQRLAEIEDWLRARL
jgi:hypothetical protein